MATGYINPGQFVVQAGAPAGFTVRWGAGVEVMSDPSALHGKSIRVEGRNPNLFSIDVLDGVADVETLLLLRVSNPFLDNRLGVWARVPVATEATAKSGYLGSLYRSTVPDNRLQISRYDNGATGASVAQTVAGWLADTRYWLRFRLSGATLSSKLWVYGTEEPAAWSIEGSDGTYSAGGWTGLGTNGASSDNVMFVEAVGWATGVDTAPSEAVDTPPPGSVAADQALAVAVSWDASQGTLFDVRKDGATIIATGLDGSPFYDLNVAVAESPFYEVRQDGGAWSEPVQVTVLEVGAERETSRNVRRAGVWV